MKRALKEKLRHPGVAALAKFFLPQFSGACLMASAEEKNYILTIKNLRKVRENSKQMWEKIQYLRVSTLPHVLINSFGNKLSQKRGAVPTRTVKR